MSCLTSFFGTRPCGGHKCFFRPHQSGWAREVYPEQLINVPRINVHSLLWFIKMRLRVLLFSPCYLLSSQPVLFPRNNAFVSKIIKHSSGICWSLPNSQFCFHFGAYCSEDQMPGHRLKTLVHICPEDRAVTSSVDMCFLLPYHRLLLWQQLAWTSGFLLDHESHVHSPLECGVHAPLLLEGSGKFLFLVASVFLALQKQPDKGE